MRTFQTITPSVAIQHVRSALLSLYHDFQLGDTRRSSLRQLHLAYSPPTRVKVHQKDTKCAQTFIKRVFAKPKKGYFAC